MEIVNFQIKDIKYRRPGLTRIEYTATFESETSEGVVVYDNINNKFLNKSNDLNIVYRVVQALQELNINY